MTTDDITALAKAALDKTGPHRHDWCSFCGQGWTRHAAFGCGLRELACAWLAVTEALDRLVASQPPPEHCTEYAMGINRAINDIRAVIERRLEKP